MEEKMFNTIYLQIDKYDGTESSEELITFAPVRVNESDVEYMKTAHIFEFIEWMSHNTRVSWSGYIFLHGASFPPKWNTIEEIYEYWITNIKTQEK